MSKIIRKYVSFEVAKLLKEKNFDYDCFSYYRKNGAIFNEINNLEQEEQNWNSKSYPDDVISRPETWQVINWIFQQHSIHIEILLNENYKYDNFYYRIMKVGEYFTLSHNGVYYYTPDEAVDEAIKYVLVNIL